MCLYLYMYVHTLFKKCNYNGSSTSYTPTYSIEIGMFAQQLHIMYIHVYNTSVNKYSLTMFIKTNKYFVYTIYVVRTTFMSK